MSESSVFIKSVSWFCIQCIFTFKRWWFSYALEIFETGLKSYLKTITFNKQLLERKSDVTYKSHMEINPVFNQNFDILADISKFTSLTHFFLILYFKKEGNYLTNQHYVH